MGVIYLRTNKVNGKKYVGQATDLKARQRRWNNLSYRYAGHLINRARNKYGLDAFGFEILKECNDDELNQWEMYYIKELNTKVPNGYNMTDGGDTSWVKGKHLSEEWKRKIGEGNKGKKRSTEVIRKISEGHKGLVRSDEWRRKQSEAHRGKKHHMYGKHLSDKTRRKIADANKNGKCSKPVIQINTKTDEIIRVFPSAMEVQRQLGYNQGNILRCCKGERKTCCGYKWRYK